MEKNTTENIEYLGRTITLFEKSTGWGWVIEFHIGTFTSSPHTKSKARAIRLAKGAVVNNMLPSDLGTLAEDLLTTAKSESWWDEADPPSDDANIAGIHSATSEALKSIKQGQVSLEYKEDGKPEGLPAELADILMRTLGYVAHKGIDIEKALAEAWWHKRKELSAAGTV